MGQYRNPAHQGYMDGLMGLDPDEALQNWSEYGDAWLIGCSDRESGVAAKPLLGVGESKLLKPGTEVTIPKGTVIKTFGKDPKPAGRTYKVKVNHCLSGGKAYWDHSWDKGKFLVRPTYPKIC